MADAVENHPAVVVPQRAAVSGGVTSTAPILGNSSAAATAVAPAASAATISGATPAAHQQRLVQLYGSQMSNVTVKPWSAIDWHTALEAFDYSAWTNSGTEIYIKDLGLPARLEPIYYIVLYHEGQHILQFRRHGGYPKTYEAMMMAEIEAYGTSAVWMAGLLVLKSARWLAKATGIKRLIRSFGIDPDSILPPTTNYHIPTTNVESLLGQSVDTATKLVAEIKRVDQQHLTGTAREAALSAFMEGPKAGTADDMLPQHQCIAELYGDPCP